MNTKNHKHNKKIKNRVKFAKYRPSTYYTLTTPPVEEKPSIANEEVSLTTPTQPQNISKSNPTSLINTPPIGYQYLSNGKLVTEEVAKQKETQEQQGFITKPVIVEKTLKSFIIDTSDLNPGGETRKFELSGDNGAMFSLEVSDADGNYYNFYTQTWSTTKSKIKRNVIKGSKYRGFVNFSGTATKTHVYTFMLFAEAYGSVKTKHAPYHEVRFKDTTLDVNSSIGSDSLLVKKIISKPQVTTLTISAIAPTRGDSITDTVDGAVSSGTNLVMDTSHLVKKIYIGDKVSGTNIATGTTITDVNVSDTLDRYTLSTAVSGTVSDGATLTFTGPFDSMTPRYGTTTGAASIELDTVSKEQRFVRDFSITLTAPTGRSFIIKRQPMKKDLLAVRLLTFGSAAIAIDGENTVSDSLFYQWPVDNVAGITEKMILDPSKSSGVNATINSYVKSYEVQTKITTDEEVIYKTSRELAGGEEERIRLAQLEYEKLIQELRSREQLFGKKEELAQRQLQDEARRKLVPQYVDVESSEIIPATTTVKIIKIDGVQPLGSPTVDRKGVITAQTGNLVFNKQQVDALKSDSSVKLLAYRSSGISSLHFGLPIGFSDLECTLGTFSVGKPNPDDQDVITTTSSAVIKSTSIPVSERAGIRDNYSLMNGVGVNSKADIDSSFVRVVSGASGNTGAGTIVVSSAQDIESGQTLNFSQANNIVTLRGRVYLRGIPESSVVVYFDVEKFLDCF